jgi:hypothetical protein
MAATAKPATRPAQPARPPLHADPVQQEAAEHLAAILEGLAARGVKPAEAAKEE